MLFCVAFNPQLQRLLNSDGDLLRLLRLASNGANSVEARRKFDPTAGAQTLMKYLVDGALYIVASAAVICFFLRRVPAVRAASRRHHGNLRWANCVWNHRPCARLGFGFNRRAGGLTSCAIT